MNINDKLTKDALLKSGYASKEDIKKAESFAKRTDGKIADYFLENELVTKDLIGQAISEYLGVHYADLNSNPPSKEQTLKINEQIAVKNRVVLFAEDDKEVTVTTDSPKKKGLELILKKIFPRKKINITYSLPEDIDDVFIHYRKGLDVRFMNVIKKKGRVAPEIIDEIIADALAYKASDIHFEPREKEVVVRFRIDGVLQEVGRIPKEYHDNIMNRIKVQAKLRIDEHDKTQDGAIRYAKGANVVDMRISIVPTLDGEKVVVRMLSEYVKGFTLSDLGLNSENKEKLIKASKSPFGMILVSGPTGSGKTTTLYSLVKTMNKPGINITTIEDPVEYKIVGLNQIQVNKTKDITFSKGLRSIVRQDPDVILVGEIRDEETAEIATNASLVGHLVFSTFHANDAATSIPRLLDMGIEPFLLASTLELMISQRLVRTICESCRVSYVPKQGEIDIHVAKHFGKGKNTLYKGKGCPVCNGTGYKGRTAIFEFIDMTSEMQELTLTHPSSQQIWKLAKKQGSKTLFEDGMEKVKNGITTLEELARVVSPNEY